MNPTKLNSDKKDCHLDYTVFIQDFYLKLTERRNFMKVQMITGMVITIIILIAVSILSGKISKREKGANSFLVAGGIMGTLVGGSTTICTA